MAEKLAQKGASGRAQGLSNSRAPGVYASFEATPAEPLIGATITGVDMTAPIPAEQVDELNHALANHNVLFFRDQPQLTPQQQVAFARNFGDLHTHPAAPTLEGNPEIFVIHTHEGSQVNNGGGWHSDVSCDEEPPMGTMLQMRQTPSAGGDTLFANMYAAYDALSPTMQRMLDGQTAMHESEHVYRGRYADRGVDDAEMVYPKAEHPVVRTHPVSGKPALFVNRAFTTRICGLTEEESAALLGFLFAHMERPQFQVRFQWRENDIAFWDNRCSQHLALWDYWPEERIGHRVTIAGERPVWRAS